jgi:hypothetical protein
VFPPYQLLIESCHKAQEVNWNETPVRFASASPGLSARVGWQSNREIVAKEMAQTGDIYFVALSSPGTGSK